jgi:hypothetical protein
MRERGAGRMLGHGRQRRSARWKMRSCGRALGGVEGRAAGAMGEGRRRGARGSTRARGCQIARLGEKMKTAARFFLATRADEDDGQIFSFFFMSSFLHTNPYIFLLSDLNLV